MLLFSKKLAVVHAADRKYDALSQRIGSLPLILGSLSLRTSLLMKRKVAKGCEMKRNSLEMWLLRKLRQFLERPSVLSLAVA